MVCVCGCVCVCVCVCVYLSLYKSICCGYSLEYPNEYPQHMPLLRGRQKHTVCNLKTTEFLDCAFIIFGLFLSPYSLRTQNGRKLRQVNMHYENMPIQIYRNFHLQKLKIFRYKNSDIFYMSAQNIDCGYSLELPQRGSSNEYPQSIFLSRDKKIIYTPKNPSFTKWKRGLMGSTLYRYVFVMESGMRIQKMKQSSNNLITKRKNKEKIKWVKDSS